MSGGLGFNKVAGALLATGLSILGLGIISNAVFHQDPPTRPGWRIAAAEAEAGASGAPAAEAPVDWGTVLPAADVSAGATLHSRCLSCHNFDNGGANGIGPNLWGVVLRATASHAGFDYSPAMRAHATTSPTWTYDELNAFIRNPQEHVSGTRMTFAGLRPLQDRINLIAYLRTLNATPAAIPAPDPARAPGAAAGAAASGSGSGAASGSGSGSGSGATSGSAATATSGAGPAAGAAARPGDAGGPAGREQNPAAEGSSAQGAAATRSGSQPAQGAGGPVNQTPTTGPAQTPTAQSNVNPGDARTH